MNAPKPQEAKRILDDAQAIQRAEVREDANAVRYDRNGWIGLAITLVVCLLIYFLFGSP
jgi:hypothetical protein